MDPLIARFFQTQWNLFDDVWHSALAAVVFWKAYGFYLGLKQRLLFLDLVEEHIVFDFCRMASRSKTISVQMIKYFYYGITTGFRCVQKQRATTS